MRKVPNYLYMILSIKIRILYVVGQVLSLVNMLPPVHHCISSTPHIVFSINNHVSCPLYLCVGCTLLYESCFSDRTLKFKSRLVPNKSLDLYQQFKKIYIYGNF